MESRREDQRRWPNTAHLIAAAALILISVAVLGRASFGQCHPEQPVSTFGNTDINASVKSESLAPKDQEVLVMHLSNESRKCLPFELSNGHWIQNYSRWIPARTQCKAWEWPSSNEGVTKQLLDRKISLIWSGNSVMRHVYFRLSHLLAGDERANATNVNLTLLYDRDTEKATCRKDIAIPPKFFYLKPGCNKGCCGVCSCMTTTQGFDQYFVWQQEWFDEKLHEVWNGLLALQGKDRQVYMVINAGLIKAYQYGEQSLVQLIEQFPAFKAWLEKVPSNVHIIYTTSPVTIMEKENDFTAAQDGLIHHLFQSLPPARRPRVIDLRPISQALVDYRDAHHFTGRTADGVIDMILHAVLNWDDIQAQDPGQPMLLST